MALGTAATCDLYDLFQGFSMLRQLARVEECLNANLIPLNFCRLYRDCTCDKLKRHFPNCVHRLDYAESRDQLMLQGPSNKRIDHHLWQILRDE
jgi:hypothetical protein